MKFDEMLNKGKKEKKPEAPPMTALVVGDGENKVEQAQGRAEIYREKLQELYDAAEVLEVDSAEKNEAIADLGLKSSKLVKDLTKERKRLIEPENTRVRAINKVFKPLTEISDKMRKLCAKKFGDYQHRVQLEERKREKAAAEAHKKLQKELDAEAERAGVEKVEAAPIVVPKAEPITRTQTGSASLRKHWTWKEVDFSKVPDEYKMLDKVKINKQVRAGIRIIGGLEIFEETRGTFRT